MAARAQCPHCGKNLKLRQAPVPERRVLCNGCDRTFLPLAQAPGAEPTAPTADTSRTSTAIAAPARPASQSIAPRPSSLRMPLAPAGPLPAPLAPPRDSRRAFLLGAVLGGLLLMMGSTALALHLATRSDGKGQQPPPSSDLSAALDPTPATGAPEPTPTPTPPPTPPPADRAEDEPTPLPQPDTPRPDDRPPAIDRPRDPPPPALPPPAPVRRVVDQGGLPREMQQLVNKAIDDGVGYLTRKQKVNGSWDDRYALGLAALPALTLLECGVPASDERIRKSARLVRSRAPRHNNRSTTYQLSLALLFLDRLGDPQDKPLIRSMAARLVAGQLPDGGWTYYLPWLQPENEGKLVRVLERTRPRMLDRPVQPPGEKKPLDRPVRPPERKDAPLDRFVPVPGAKGKPDLGVAQPGSKPETPPGGSTRTFDGNAPAGKPGVGKAPPARKDPEKKKGNEPDRPLEPAEARKVINTLPPRFRGIPALVDATGKGSPGNPLVVSRSSDNSNTQFATLALWAARRHGLPVERSLDLVARRFRTTQMPNGIWKYKYPTGHITPAMTGAGLIGLAVGHGLEADGAGKKVIKDVRVDAGLKALGSQIGKPFGAKINQKVRLVRGRGLRTGQPRGPINLYFLWTVERVGVIYHVREMDGKDWYRWGVDLLLDAQANDGSWNEGNYRGAFRAVDTCFALLFLRRANFAADLTKRLDFVVPGKPVESPSLSTK